MSLQGLANAVEPVPFPTAASAMVEERRRPNSLDRASSYLISRLRGSTATDILVPLFDNVDAPSLDDDLALARDCRLGLLLSVPVWAIIGLMLWVVLR